MTLPKVSIVIPSFNSEQYIDETVRSVLAQTYKDLEVVVDDNDSKDATVGLVKRLAEEDPRVQLFAHKEDKNIPEGWNRAISEARGKYLLLLHSDNLMHPQYLEWVVPQMEKLQAKLAFTECDYFEGATPTDLFSSYEAPPKFSLLAPGPRAVAYVFRHQRMVPTSCLLIDRDCLDGRPAYYPRYEFDPDMEQLSSLVELYGALHLHQTLAAIRTHPGQAPSWRRPGFSTQYRELLTLQHQKGQTEREHFLKAWTDSNQDISTTLAKNHAPWGYFLRYQLKWLGAELNQWGYHSLGTLRHLKKWALNFRTWFRSKAPTRVTPPTEKAEVLTEEAGPTTLTAQPESQ